MKLLLLTKLREALVDDEDYERCMKYSWRVAIFQKGMTEYAQRNLPRDGGTRKGQYLHNFILPPPIGFTVDHIDRNGLNCQKSNLRFATKSQQMINVQAKEQYGFRVAETSDNGDCTKGLHAWTG